MENKFGNYETGLQKGRRKYENFWWFRFDNSWANHNNEKADDQNIKLYQNQAMAYRK